MTNKQHVSRLTDWLGHAKHIGEIAVRHERVAGRGICADEQFGSAVGRHTLTLRKNNLQIRQRPLTVLYRPHAVVGRLSTSRCLCSIGRAATAERCRSRRRTSKHIGERIAQLEQVLRRFGAGRRLRRLDELIGTGRRGAAAKQIDDVRLGRNRR